MANNSSEPIRPLGEDGRRTAPPRIVEAVETFQTTTEPPHVGPNRRVEAITAERSALSWRSVFAGALVALLTYAILMSLGIAVGGTALEGIIRGGSDSATGLGWGTGIWVAVATIISLFVGGYASSRASGLIDSRVGRTQGLVVSALFFAILLSQLGATIGSIGKGVGSIVAGATGAGVAAVQSDEGQQIMGQALNNLDLKSPPDQVARGVAGLLLRGDSAGARDFLADQAGIPPEEAQARIDSLKSNAEQAARSAAVGAAQGASIAGWSLFGALLLGSIFAMLGGAVGARSTLRNPLENADRHALRGR